MSDVSARARGAGSYGRACQRVLRTRTLIAYGAILLSSAAVTAIFSLRLGLPRHLATQEFATLLFRVLLACLAVAVVRRRMLTVCRQSSATLVKEVARFFRARVALLVAVYAATSLCIIWSFVHFMGGDALPRLVRAVAMARRETPTSPPVHLTLYVLDGGQVGLVVFAIIVGAVLAVRDIAGEHLVLAFPPIQQSPYFAVKGRLATLLSRALRSGMVAVVCAWVARPLLEAPFARFAVTLFGAVTHLPTELADTALPYSPVWAGRLFVASALCDMLLSLQATIMEVAVTCRMSISSTMPSPAAALVDGLADGNPLVQWHAHLELSQAVSHRAELRLELFERFDAAEGGWRTCSTLLLSGIDALTTTINNARKSASPGSQAPASARDAVGRPRPLPPSARQPVALPAQLAVAVTAPGTQRPGLLEALLDLVVERIPSEPTAPLLPPAREEPALPNLLRGVGQEAAASTARIVSGATATTLRQRTALSEISAPWAATASQPPPADTRPPPSWLSRWPRVAQLLQPSPLRQTRAMYGDLTLHMWRVQILTQVCAASKAEDTYGSVQQTLPTVIAALIDCLVAIEAHVQSIPPHERHAEGHQLLLRHPFALADVLQTGLYQVATTFYESLSELQLSAKHASRLQHFVDFDA